jgi:hypothetical protein
VIRETSHSAITNLRHHELPKVLFAIIRCSPYSLSFQGSLLTPPCISTPCISTPSIRTTPRLCDVGSPRDPSSLLLAICLDDVLAYTVLCIGRVGRPCAGHGSRPVFDSDRALASLTNTAWRSILREDFPSQDVKSH